MNIGNFDSDFGALASRLALQQELGTFDLNSWILDNAAPFPGALCLDLGCGTGAQTFALAEKVGSEGFVTAVDISEEAVSSVNDAATKNGVSDRVRAIGSDLDSIGEIFKSESFDRIVGAYSLYYVTHIDCLFSTLAGLLRPGGCLFYCGPAYDNNLEIRSFIAGISGTPSPESTSASEFMEETSQASARRHFASVKSLRFENPITYATAHDLVRYWRNHNLFHHGLDETFVREAGALIERDGAFVNVKRGIGVLAHK